MSETKQKPTGLALMREPFPEHQISKMCRSTKKDNQKGTCSKCKGYHGLPAIQLSYVGHAALTDRLLEADPNWNWEPVSVDEHGFPYLDKDGGMWIKLTVCGVTRLGYGDNQNQTGGNATKERIGDALRNAAMRFGAALDLWHKGDLRVAEDDEEPEPEKKPDPGGNGHDEAAKIAAEKEAAEKAAEKAAADKFRDEFKTRYNWFASFHIADVALDILGKYGYTKAVEVPKDKRADILKELDKAKAEAQAKLSEQDGGAVANAVVETFETEPADANAVPPAPQEGLGF